jgi:hypothetical protein
MAYKMSMSQHKIGWRESRQLQKLQRLSDKLQVGASGEWREKWDDTEVYVADTKQGGRLSRRVFLGRKVSGCVITSEVIIESGKPDSPLPSVKATHYNGADTAFGDRPTRYDSENRDANSYVFGQPSGTSLAISALKQAISLQHTLGTESQLMAAPSE